MHGMANIMRCNLSISIGVRTLDNQIKVGVANLPGKVKCSLAWQHMAWVSYINFKRSGENLIGIPKYSAFIFIRCDANYNGTS
jgi:hypothetical protein